jgi:hypothetical protein
VLTCARWSSAYRAGIDDATETLYNGGRGQGSRYPRLFFPSGDTALVGQNSPVKITVFLTIQKENIMSNEQNPQPQVIYVQAPPQKSGIVKKGCIGCAGIFAVLIVLSVIFSPDKEKVEQEEAQIVRQEVNPISISADELMTAYTDNKIAAEMEYKRKILVVDGTISSLGDDIIGKLPHVKLKTSNFIATVHCSFQERDRVNLAALQKGQYVKIRGRCEEMAGDIWLKNCSFEE